MVERSAESIRDGVEAANERHMAEVEMEQGLIAQKQYFQRRSNLPIVEQADGSNNAHEDGANVITATHGGTDTDGGGSSIGAPGAGTDPSETQTSSEQTTSDVVDHGPRPEDNVEYEGDERTSEEISQLVYHLQVLMVAKGLTPADVWRHL